MDILLVVIAAVFVLGVLAITLAKRVPRVLAPPAAPDVPPACRACKHFDLEEGQAVLRNHPHFLQAAQYVSPAEMGRVAKAGPPVPCKDCGGQGKLGTGRYTQAPTGAVPWPQDAEEIMDSCAACDGVGTIETQEMSPPSAPYKAEWSEFGACLSSAASDDGDSSIVWSGDICEHFERGELVQLRRPA